MPSYAALLRAVNVGGTGKLAMSDLRRLCEQGGLSQVATYIQSGNVVFRSTRSEASVKKLLEAALAQQLGKPCGVLVRQAAELRELLADNPFPDAAPNRVMALFLDAPPPAASLKGIVAGKNLMVVANNSHIFTFEDFVGHEQAFAGVQIGDQFIPTEEFA